MTNSLTQRVYCFWMAIALAAVGCDASSGIHALPASEAETETPADASTAAAADSGGKNPITVADASSPVTKIAPPIEPPSNCGLTEPPPLVMSTSSGEQQGTNGSYCAGRLGCNSLTCADRGVPFVDQYTIVHPGDEVIFSMPAGTVLDRQNTLCAPDCPPLLSIQRTCMGQRRTLQSEAFHEDQVWKVSLSQGSYIISADYRFAGDEGVNGGTTADFGLIVDSHRDRAIVDVREPPEDCVTPTEQAADADAGV